MPKTSYTEILGNMLHVLSLIKREKGATQSEICESLGIDRKTARRYIDDIQKLGNGLNIFEEESPDDKRSVVYKVDPKDLWALALPDISEDVPIKRTITTPCLEKYGMDWTEEQKTITRDSFGSMGATMMQHIKGGYAIGYDAPMAPDEFIPMVPKEHREDHCILFSFTDWDGPWGEKPKGAAFLNAYPFVEDALDDGWKVST